MLLFLVWRFLVIGESCSSDTDCKDVAYSQCSTEGTDTEGKCECTDDYNYQASDETCIGNKGKVFRNSANE